MPLRMYQALPSSQLQEHFSKVRKYVSPSSLLITALPGCACTGQKLNHQFPSPPSSVALPLLRSNNM